MHHRRASNQSELSPDLFLFTSPWPATRVCLIVAHGGVGAALPRSALPEGLRVRYWVEHGHTLFTSAYNGIVCSADAFGLYAAGGRLAAADTSQLPLYGPPFVEAGPTAIIDYRLSKIALAPLAPYIKIELMMRNVLEQTAQEGRPACPHVVTLRKRSEPGRPVSLGQVIEVVVAKHPEVDEFHLHACRAVLRSRGDGDPATDVTAGNRLARLLAACVGGRQRRR